MLFLVKFLRVSIPFLILPLDNRLLFFFVVKQRIINSTALKGCVGKEINPHEIFLSTYMCFCRMSVLVPFECESIHEIQFLCTSHSYHFDISEYVSFIQTVSRVKFIPRCLGFIFLFLDFISFTISSLTFFSHLPLSKHNPISTQNPFVNR